VTLATWEAEIRKIEVGGWPGQKVHEISCEPMAEHHGVCLPSQLCGEAQIEGLMSRPA
jgi:hypothetical protein